MEVDYICIHLVIKVITEIEITSFLGTRQMIQTTVELKYPQNIITEK